MILNSVTNQAEQADILKNQLIQDFFTEFGAEGQFLEDYTAELNASYEAARDAGELPSVSEITVEVPFVPESCENLVMQMREDINNLLAELNMSTDCINFFTDSVCGDIASQVDTILAENTDLVPDVTARIQ